MRAQAANSIQLEAPVGMAMASNPEKSVGVGRLRKGMKKAKSSLRKFSESQQCTANVLQVESVEKR